jgi:hypothetical protein
MVTQQDGRKTVHGRAVLLEQILRRLRRLPGVFHRPAIMYNGPAARL